MNKGKNNILTRFFSHNITLMILSFVLAFVIWFIINASSETDTNVTISNIPITVELSDTAEEDGLQIFNSDVLTASVEVNGNRVTVGSLSPSDILITANQTGSIISPGTYTLPLSVKKSGLKTNFNIVSSVSPSSVTVFVDRFSEAEFSIENRISVQLSDSNHYASTALSQSVVSVSGPETQVSQIASVAVFDSVTADSDESITVQEKIRYYDSDSKELDLPLVTADVESIEVTINVLPVKTVRLAVELDGAPDNCPSVSISPETIKIAGAQSVLDEINNNTVVIGALDFSTLKNEKNKLELDLSLPSGCKAISGVSKASVSVDLSKYKGKTLDVRITEKLDTSKYSADFNIETAAVTVYGPEELIDEIKTSDLSVVADFTDMLSDVNDENAVSLSVPLTVRLANTYSECWIYGTYFAEVNVTMK